MEKFIILGSHRDYCEVMCTDLLNQNNVYFENKFDSLNNQMIKFIKKKHLGDVNNKFHKVAFEKIWYSRYLDEKKISKKDKNFFVFFDANIHLREEGYLDYLRKKYNGYIILIAVNKFGCYKTHDIEYFNKNFDLIFTTEPNDSKKYNYIYLNGIYSVVDKAQDVSKIEHDIFFVGGNKGRLKILHDIVRKLNENNIQNKINITGVKECDRNLDLKINYKYMEYREVVNNVISSNCLLDVVQEGQGGVTLRTMEALVYNKKYLTNNETIKESVFYNPKYMKIFKEVDDISIDFILDKEEVNYNYNGECSPLRILKIIQDHFKDK